MREVGQGGTIRTLNGNVATRQEAVDLINEAGGEIQRFDLPHEPPNPHDFPHINYTTGNGVKGTIEIQGL